VVKIANGDPGVPLSGPPSRIREALAAFALALQDNLLPASIGIR
jgi:hypothetical protein